MRTIAIYRVLILVLSLSAFSSISCATVQEQLAERNTVQTPLPCTEGDCPGSLVAVGTTLRIDSTPFALAFRLASLRLLGFGIDTALLRAEGYQDWQAQTSGRLEDVEAIPIQYRSEVIPGERETQSGMLFLPWSWRRTKALSWIVYAKGTELKRYDVPSRNIGPEARLGTMMAALGYAVWMPDYPGMGVAPGMHPYCDPGSLARSILHGLAAARSFVGGSLAETGRLYLVGYSEGGLAVMAAARAVMDPEWEESAGDMIPRGLPLAGVYAMGAPLDLTDLLLTNLKPGTKPESSANLLYLFAGQARVRPDLVNLERTLLPDIRGAILPYVGSDRGTGELEAMIASLRGKNAKQITAEDLFTAAFLERLAIDGPADPVYRSLGLSRMDLWTPDPSVPMTLAASRSDKLVPYAISEAAMARFMTLRPEGSAPLRLVDLASDTHVRAGIESLFFAIMDIDRKEQALQPVVQGAPTDSPETVDGRDV